VTEQPAPAEAEPAGRGTPPGYGDLVSGGLAVGFGITVLLYIRGFPQLPGGQPGPALFPGIVAGLFVLFGGILVVRWFAQRRSGDGGLVDETEQPERPTTKAWLTALSMCAAVVVYLLVVDLLGFTVTMSVLLFALMKLLGTRTLVAAIAAVTTAVVLMLLFQMVLLVPLPTGIVG
jgi:putative tricarboxylic transport membrane protein